MLVRFAVTNFKSFKEQAVFSMAAGKFTRHPSHIRERGGKRLLTGAFLFGANAGGKSNFVQAAAFARDAALTGLRAAECDKKFFRLDPRCRNRPGVFQFDLFENGSFYSYGFAVSYAEARVVEEWLYVLGGREKCVFHRRGEKGASRVDSDLDFGDPAQKRRFDVYREDMGSARMNGVFLLPDVARRAPPDAAGYGPFRDVLRGLSRMLFLFPGAPCGGGGAPMSGLSGGRPSLQSLLGRFGTGISSIKTRELGAEEAARLLASGGPAGAGAAARPDGRPFFRLVPSGGGFSLVEFTQGGDGFSAREILSAHGGEEEPFLFCEESNGTRRLFELLPILPALREDPVVFVDELDRSLHTGAVLEFIRLFYEMSEGASAQLIATTHDLNVLDLDLLRQDEIWFVERRPGRGSRLYSLDEYRVRFDKRIGRDYLLGRYGAAPLFSRLCPSGGGAEA